MRDSGGPVDPSSPASVLQLRPHTTVILDGAAASRLTRRHDIGA